MIELKIYFYWLLLTVAIFVDSLVNLVLLTKSCKGISIKIRLQLKTLYSSFNIFKCNLLIFKHPNDDRSDSQVTVNNFLNRSFGLFPNLIIKVYLKKKKKLSQQNIKSWQNFV